MNLLLKVRQLIHRGDLDTAAEYARLAYSRNYCEPTADTCDGIIRAMCEAKRYRDTFDLFHYFYNELKMGSTCHSPFYIIKALCDLGRLDDAIVFWRATSSQSCPYLIIKGLVDEEGRLDEAVCFVRKYKVPPLAWSNVVSGFLKLGNHHVANQLLEEFESNTNSESESEAPLVRLLTFIEHSFNQGKGEEAKRCYESFMCNNKGDKGVVNVCGDVGKELLKLLLKYGKKTEAWILFNRMLDGFKMDFQCLVSISVSKNVDSETIDIMVGECFKEGVETFYKAKAKGAILKPVNYRNVITCCCEQGMLSEAECLVAEYSDVHVYRALMNAYVKAGRVGDALQLANNMVDGDLKKFALDMLN
ncbi:unnamed protein product [Eruca vesicaria subsp. sativa]|uniref:Pentatricopeptide repeat-containing protein n=1 Tax=Eruca vesicaria subsp. sativa TaxID=29727 RepID=A0ABC8MAF0_ERUVS|nr:unnamed protein product [Eruca vesicaria subsp. sativa]